MTPVAHHPGSLGVQTSNRILLQHPRHFKRGQVDIVVVLAEELGTLPVEIVYHALETIT
jgi:hypothetical protein